jgi:glycosyltransferase involved in cell wall biosynthesis
MPSALSSDAPISQPYDTMSPATASPTTIGFDARFINDRYHGIGRHAFNLLEALTRLDQRRYVAYYCPSLTNTRFDLRMLATRPNVTLQAIDLPLYSPREQLFWPAQLAADGITLFHSPYVALPLLSSVPLLMTIHDVIFERFPEYMPHGALRHFYAAQTQLSVRRASGILTVSNATRIEAKQFYPKATSKMHVIGGAVDAGFHPERGPEALAEVRTRYALPERFILTVGAGRPHKNVATVVDALARIDPAYAPALVVVGEADRRFPDEVAERAQANRVSSRIFRLGLVREEDLPALYSLADVFVFPSLVEGFGLPPLEAMACGTPVIASNASSIPEVVADAALDFDPLDAAQLARRLLRVLSDGNLRAVLVERGFRRAALLTWDRVAQRTRAVYDGMLGDRDRTAAHDEAVTPLPERDVRSVA